MFGSSVWYGSRAIASSSASIAAASAASSPCTAADHRLSASTCQQQEMPAPG